MRAYTGVGAIFCGAHQDAEGKIHGHSYEVIAWFRAGQDAVSLQNSLRGVIAIFDHSDLDKTFPVSWSENMAQFIKSQLDNCVRVEIKRPLERLYAVVG
jgi:6-pyruvoyl-tetrahydropterin synthase